MEACLSIKIAYLDWLICKKCLLGGHGKARCTVIGCGIDFSNCQIIASWITGFAKISVPLAMDMLILTFSCSRVCSTTLSLRCLQCLRLSVIL